MKIFYSLRVIIRSFFFVFLKSYFFKAINYKKKENDKFINSLTNIFKNTLFFKNINLVFDNAYYIKNCNRSNIQSHSDSYFNLIHFLDNGYYKEISPHPFIDISFVKRIYPHLYSLGPVEVLSQIIKGKIDPHPLFSNIFYRIKYKDVQKAKLSPFYHFLKYGIDELRDPSPYISSRYFFSLHINKEISKKDAFFELFEDSRTLEHIAHPLFSPNWYLLQLPEDERNLIAKKPLEHFSEYGDSRGISPHPYINLKEYLSINSDVLLAKIKPFFHLWVYGLKEGRKISNKGSQSFIKEFSDRMQPTHPFSPLKFVLLGCFDWISDKIEWNIKRQSYQDFMILSNQEFKDKDKDKDKDKYIEKFSKPKFINGEIKCEDHKIKNSRNQLGFIENVYGFGGSHLVVSLSDNAVYGPEHNNQEERFWTPRGPLYSQYTSTTHLRIRLCKASKNEYESGYLLCSEYDCNYYHWMTEVLPLTEFLDMCLVPYDVPLVITLGLHENLIESLQKIVGKDRKIIKLQTGVPTFFKKLYIPFNSNHVADNYFGPIRPGIDISIDPKDLHYVRHSLLNKFQEGDVEKSLPSRFLISRPRNSFRHPVNFSNLSNEIKSLGFTIIEPGLLTLGEQIALFSNAEIILAPTGAALANIIFCKPNTKVLVFFGDHKASNYYLFSYLAESFSVDFTNLLCPMVPVSSSKMNSIFSIHENYSVPISEVLKWVNNVKKDIDKKNFIKSKELNQYLVNINNDSFQEKI